jgi:SlyX protein
MPSPDQLSERIVSLETLLTHLQHDVEQMHEVLLAQGRELDALRTTVERLERRLQHSAEVPEEMRGESATD